MITPGSTNIFKSYSSGFDNAFIAFLYATVPPAVADDKSNPCEFPATIAEPTYTFLFGWNPSNPPWNGTKNFLLSIIPSFNVIAAQFDEQLLNKNLSPTVVVTESGVGLK